MQNGDETFMGAIDQGTSSTRFLIFNTRTQEVVASHQVARTRSKSNSNLIYSRSKSPSTSHARAGSKNVPMKSSIVRENASIILCASFWRSTSNANRLNVLVLPINARRQLYGTRTMENLYTGQSYGVTRDRRKRPIS